MAVPAFLTALAPALGKGLGEALPYLTLGLFGKKGQERPMLSTEEAELMRLRSQLAQMALQRQGHLDPLFSALSQGAFNFLPKHMTEGITPNASGPGAQFRTSITSDPTGVLARVRARRDDLNRRRG